jgi:hypothetical protein
MTPMHRHCLELDLHRLDLRFAGSRLDTASDPAVSNDTTDSCDTSSVAGGLTGRSVATVNSVMASGDRRKAAMLSRSGEASAAADHPLVRGIMQACPGSRIHAVHGLTAAGLATAMQRAPAWADPAALSVHGCWCRCCHGSRWWCERAAPKGWRCWTCHPPIHLPSEALTQVST